MVVQEAVKMGKLDGKTAIITGCSSGIGKQTAIRFAEEGANVAMCARRLEKLEETAKICQDRGAEVVYVKADVTVENDLKNLVDKTIERFGTVDILVNNAMGGLPGGKDSQCPFIETPLENYEAYMKANLYADVTLMKLCYPYMRDKEDASIINFSSSAGIGMRKMGIGRAAYGVAKAAVTSMSRIAADELGEHNIRVNIIYPEIVQEHLLERIEEEKRTGVNMGYADKWVPLLSDNALHRPGDAYRDCAPVLVFLASEDSRFITGQSFQVCGGHWMTM
jgi:NAD(P)-dependent dehydrogenase (short-subunit alcohol dehydrogenase family)